MWLFVVLSFALLTTSSSRPPLRETVEVNGRLYHEVSPESHRMLLSLNESELDPRHVFIDQHGRRLATHLKFSPSELESEMVCTQQPWSEAHSLPGWCPQARYPGKYKPCPQCFIENWCSTNAPWYGITCNGPMMTGRIIRLEFESNEPIGGEIYSNFPFFTDIEKIGLLSNGLSGGIPGNLGGCAGLTHMSLDKNQLSGDVPGRCVLPLLIFVIRFLVIVSYRLPCCSLQCSLFLLASSFFFSHRPHPASPPPRLPSLAPSLPHSFYYYFSLAAWEVSGP